MAEPVGDLHYHRLLVPVDGSDSSTLALGAAVTVAHRDHASLTLLCVVSDVLAEASHWTWATPQSPATMQEEADADAQRTLREAVERVPEDIPVKTLVRRGKAGPEIVKHAGDSDYDAIVMGARGMGRVGAAIIGSVSQHVMRHAKVPVFVAHAPAASGE
jgi:nucleotide-binding universal stress UspA family protein